MIDLCTISGLDYKAVPVKWDESDRLILGARKTKFMAGCVEASRAPEGLERSAAFCALFAEYEKYFRGDPDKKLEDMQVDVLPGLIAFVKASMA